MTRTLDDRIAALAGRQHGLVARRQLKVLGASDEAIRHRVAKRRLIRARPGVFRVAGAPRTAVSDVLAAVLASGSGAVASHATAGALLGVPGFGLRAVAVSVPRGRRPRLSGISVHHTGALPDWQTRVADSIPITSVARTLFDLCGTVNARRAERALDTCLSRKLVTIPACWRVLAHLAERGRAGTTLMRALLEARGEGFVAPASELEARLLELLKRAGLPQPAREIDVGDADGWIGRVELVYREARLLIEADSRLHHTSLLDRDADRARDNRFMAEGWRVLRFDWDQVTQQSDAVARTVAAALRSAA